MVACSEGPDSSDVARGETFLGQTGARFPLVKPLLGEARRLEEHGTRFRFRAASEGPNISGAWRPSGRHRLSAEFPAHAGGATRISNGPVTLEIRAFGARGAQGVLAEGRRAVLYRGAYADSDSFFVAGGDRVEEFILLASERAPRRFEYQLEVVKGVGRVRQLEGVVEVLDADGVAWLRLTPPFLVDGNGKRRDIAFKLDSGRLTLILPERRMPYPVLVDPGWTSTGTMSRLRNGHSAVLLKSGKVLVMGSAKGVHLDPKSAELYDPKTGTWTATGSMSKDRQQPHCMLLSTGKVIVIGNYGTANASTTELYDPTTGNWTAAASLTESRYFFTATLLQTGKVLVAGGLDPTDPSGITGRKSAELYDPVSGTWKLTGNMKSARWGHQAALLNSGKVLVMGGDTFAAELLSELYDPSNGAWAATGKLLTPFYGGQAVTLKTGKVLAVPRNTGSAQLKTQLYSPASGTWTYSGSISKSREGFSTTMLLGGSVLLAGGASSGTYYTTTSLYKPNSGLWTTSGDLTTNRKYHSATRLQIGAVLVAGGDVTIAGAASTAELFDPTAGLTCKTAKDCAMGQCVDGICCPGPCTETCRKCVPVSGANGTFGKCSGYVAAGQQDLDASKPCSGASLCDGNGACKKGNGQACTAAADCGSGFCVDGVCCAGGCSAPCFACNLKGKAGSCSHLPINAADANAKPPCAGKSACDGVGVCRSALGQPCTNNASCASGICMDGRCCDKACLTTCHSCNVVGKEGTCSPLTDASDTGCEAACVKCSAGKCTPLALGATVTVGAKTCTGSQACDGSGSCKKVKGKTCAKGLDCVSDQCWDNRCCDVSCEKICRSCNLSKKEGTCSFILQGDDPDNDCIGKHPLCGGACDGKGACEFPGLGTLCGKCQACDGTGNCTKTPVDDTQCGTIDCDKLDTACRDYHDLTTARCDSFGACKKPNVAATCVKFTDVCGDAGAPDRGSPDKGTSPDSGADIGKSNPDLGTPPPLDKDEGCSVAAGDRRNAGRPGLVAAMLLLALLRRSRKRPGKTR